MINEETKEIYRRIFAVRPDYEIWLAEKTPNPGKTLTCWRAMLLPIPYEAADAIVSEVERGVRQMPEAYDRGACGAIVRSWCQRRVDDENRDRNNATIRDQGSRGATGAVYRDYRMGATVRALNDADDRCRAGEISDDERLRIRQEAWSAFHAAN